MRAEMQALPSATLWDLEEDLLSLLETEDLVPDSQRNEFEMDLRLALQKSVEKRDRVANFLAHCSMQQENCDREIERLRRRKESFERAEKRMKMYVQRVIESLGPDAKGKPKKLEGNLATFSLRQAPGHVEITDESKVPADMKVVEICMPLPQWTRLVNAAGLDLVEARSKVTINKLAAKRRVEAGEDVPGIDLTVGGYCLVVK